MKPTEKLYKEFGKQWKLKPAVVQSIYVLIVADGGRYKRSRKVLASLDVHLTSRQLSYFYRKCTLYRRLNVDKKGFPANWSSFLKEL